MKLDKADVLFSKYIRTRDNWTCQRCGKKYPERSQGLHCSHFFGRSRESTRFDPENCDALCFGCHRYFGSDDMDAYREFKVKQLGKKKYEHLTIRSRTYCKKDRKAAYYAIKELIKSL